jgi:outer membrane lipoprotein-sorting protein
MNGGRAKIVKNSTNVQEFKGPEAKMFKDLGKVMMTLLEQTSRRGKRIGPTIFPVPKDMRHLYSKITLYHNKQTGVIEKVVMQEIEGDYTVIEFKNVKTNIKIDKGMFK